MSPGRTRMGKFVTWYAVRAEARGEDGNEKRDL